MMREAVKNNSANTADLAKLEDRLALSQGKKTAIWYAIRPGYQTNCYYLLPVEYAKNIDMRRKAMGLLSMGLHLSGWGI